MATDTKTSPKADAKTEGKTVTVHTDAGGKIVGETSNRPDAPKTDTKPADDELSIEFLDSGAVMLAEALTAETMPVRQRNERQMVMDAKVKALHDSWTAKGKVGDWNSLVKAGVVATYFVEPQKSAKFKALVNKAALFHSVRVRYGSSFVVTGKHIAQFNLKPEFEGREAISFAILDKKPRSTTTAAAKPETDAAK